jgi:SpoVK/Ycf46/Vps4 family AAA+-type ATPase
MLTISFEQSGPPGVGKTLTAEAIAEEMQIPFYMMSAGDIGTDPDEVETALIQILKMTTRWGAILLLDEADVFLEARSTSDLERNKLVSIFLRVLEYFEDFLFLTSNRVDNIDAAFESRIHLSLRYDGLNFEARKQVWVAFLGQSIEAEWFTGEQIDTLAEMDLNGRQIKNILKTAQLLATSKGTPLSFEHVQVITNLRAAHSGIPIAV